MVVVGGTRKTSVSVWEAWSLLCDVDAYPRWVDATDRILEQQPGDLHEGYQYREYGGLPPFKGESSWTITEWQPMTRQVHIGDDGYVTMNLEVDVKAGSPSEVSLTLTMTPRWYIAPIFYPLWLLFLRARAEATMRETLDNLTAELERLPSG